MPSSKKIIMRLFTSSWIPSAIVVALFAVVMLLLELNDVHVNEPSLLFRASQVKSRTELDAITLHPWINRYEEMENNPQKAAASRSLLYKQLVALHTPEPDTYVDFQEQVSPDKKWVMVYRYSHGLGDERAEPDTPLRYQVDVISADGTRHLKFQTKCFDSGVFWTADSHRWAEVASGRVIYHSLDDLSAETSVSHVMQLTGGLQGRQVNVGQVEIGRYGDYVIVPCSFEPRSTAMQSATSWNLVDFQWQQPDLRWCILDLQSNPVTARPVNSSLPPETHVGKVVPSPDGSKIALECVRRSYHPLLGCLSLFFPAWKNRADMSNASLWICRTDGSGLHEIGYVPYMAGSVQDLQWSRDGGKLIFTSSKGNEKKGTTWIVDSE